MRWQTLWLWAQASTVLVLRCTRQRQALTWWCWIRVKWPHRLLWARAQGVRANGRDVREPPLMQRAYDTWPHLHERLGADPFYERVGQLLVFESDKDADVARAQAWVQHQHEIPTDWLTKDALLEREPELSNAVRGALFCPMDGVASTRT